MNGLSARMLGWMLVGLASLTILGCGDSGDSAGSAAPPSETENADAGSGSVADPAVESTEPMTPVPGESAADPSLANPSLANPGAKASLSARSLERDGIALVVGGDGTIKLTGADRWGGQIDTAFESLEYLTNAVPVLKRSLTDEQAQALEALVKELSASAGTTPGPESATAS